MKETIFLLLMIKSALQVLATFNPVHPLVLEILEWIFLLNKKHKIVEICWVPSHVGILGNEQADSKQS